MNSLLSLCLSACLSARPSVRVFSRLHHQFFLILHRTVAEHDTQWLTKSDFWKKSQRPDFWLNWPKSGPNEVFVEFGSQVFLEIAYNDSLQQCVTSSGGEILEKKSGEPTRNQVLRHFLKFGSLVFFQIAFYDSLERFLTTSPIKNLASRIWAQQA